MSHTRSEETRHPREHIQCNECGAGAATWTKHRSLPQIGQTFRCSECGHEVYVYDAADRGQTNKQWRPVTAEMAKNLLFFEEVGDWPDSTLSDLFKQGVERAEAIDYEIVESHGLSQSDWAEKTERSQPTVSENIRKAKRTLATD